MERLDEIAVANGLPIRTMMELAGERIIPVFDALDISKDSHVAVVCGKGNKGGDGIVAARYLLKRGHNVTLILVTDDIKPDPEYYLEELHDTGVHIIHFKEKPNETALIVNKADVIVDALIGYHLDGAPRDNFKTLIEEIKVSDAFVISYDVPSGVDATTGECFDPCVRADATLTLALPKKAFQTENGKDKSGKVFLGDIGIPASMYDKIEKGSRPNFPELGVIEL